MNHVRGMMWLLFSISFCLAAASLTLGLDQRQHSTIDHLAMNSHSSVRSVYTRMGAAQGSGLTAMYSDTQASGDLDMYTGLQIIHSLKQWCIQGQVVIVDGWTLTTGRATDSLDVLEESRNIALTVLDLNAEYMAKRTYYADGNIQNMLFYQR
ncbi:hypothetical protein [Paenibacillus senegalimassiliensis]|uniref:hypothetical protein n=1 Tax=Paenibacillus senegalimassiliensis TaxID=1737426 RepID=UPI0011DD79FE|nr:hypothetical protein [Paenibacillus senegalimassiliensis]